MVFSSPIFLFLFLPLTLLATVAVRREWRNLVLLAASLIFYAWGEGEIVLFMLLSCLVNFSLGLWLDRTPGTAYRKWIMAVTVAFNLGLLGFYKYSNFFVANLNTMLGVIGQDPLAWDPVRLPTGISFFTFQAMSYVIDVFRRDTPVNRRPVDFSLYIALYPQLIAGPIVRYHDIAQQLANHELNVTKFASGVRRFVIGLGKKVLIANTLAGVADPIFSLPAGALTPSTAWLGIVCFVIQVYFDFSGYSDMAIGLGRMIGFEFLENFNYPYISQSLREFWRRWHISLSTWFRDYVYIPLGGNRLSSARTYVNLFIVFLLVGLWHGANWTFVVFGMIQGTVMVAERLGWEKFMGRFWRPMRHAYLLLVILLSFVFFRVPTLGEAWHFIGTLFDLRALETASLAAHWTPELGPVLMLGVLGSLPVLPWLKEHWRHWSEVRTEWSTWMRTASDAGEYLFLLAVLLLSAANLAGGTYDPFIYFRF